eukprot:TRINITY_DN5874_c0_g1_i2.p2 TRINITY_DN5874_c0_g1~~TRINITY_DN5874_c0_g1_i2.p2  ORF type:complete len:176 (-),score=73.73 TRINITY_DN5874_c0_g1_i2:438-965(-)
MYFEGGHSSVYFWDLEGNNFAGCFLIQKDVEAVRGLNSGFWNSIHVVEATEMEKKGNEVKYEYKLTTTVIISMRVQNAQLGSIDLSGTMTKQSSCVGKLSGESTHISNIGRMLEEVELAIRNSIEGIYIQKTREVISGMRSSQGMANPSTKESFTASLREAVGKHGQNRAVDSES